MSSSKIAPPDEEAPCHAPSPNLKHSPESWLSFLDKDGDGFVSDRDLIAALFLIGASPTLTEYKTLLCDVRADPPCFARIVYTSETPTELKLKLDEEKNENEKDLYPAWQWNLIAFLSYAFLMPMANIKWPLR